MTTLREHMPKKHRAYADWSPAKAKAWAAEVGVSAQAVVAHLLHQSNHLLVGLRGCAGLAQLSRGFGSDRLESACRRAVAIGGYSYTSIKSILERGLDRQPLESPEQEPQITHHPNVHGPAYYQGKEAADVVASDS